MQRTRVDAAQFFVRSEGLPGSRTQRSSLLQVAEIEVAGSQNDLCPRECRTGRIQQSLLQLDGSLQQGQRLRRLAAKQICLALAQVLCRPTFCRVSGYRWSTTVGLSRRAT